MNYFLFKIDGSAPGMMWMTQRAHFWKCRWGIEEEVFLLREERLFPGIKAGDILFIAMDGVLLGYVTLTRVEEGLLGYRAGPVQELWFRGDKIVVLPRLILSHDVGRQLPASWAQEKIAQAEAAGIVYAKNEDA